MQNSNWGLRSELATHNVVTGQEVHGLQKAGERVVCLDLRKFENETLTGWSLVVKIYENNNSKYGFCAARPSMSQGLVLRNAANWIVTQSALIGF
jgi:hypothetical protein